MKLPTTNPSVVILLHANSSRLSMFIVIARSDGAEFRWDFLALCARMHQTESQAGERPCTEESAGKRRLTPVSRYRRRIWAQTDWAVKYHEKTYLPWQYRLLAGCQSRERGPGTMDHLMPEIIESNESTARVVKAIRESGYPLHSGRITDFAMWLLTAVYKLEGEIGVPKPGDGEQESLIRIGNKYSDLLWNRFPRCCPLCYWRRSGGDREKEREPGFLNPCDCLHHEIENVAKSDRRRLVEALRRFSNSNRELQPQGIDEWQHIFGSIFSVNVRDSNLTHLAFHLM